MTGDAKIWPPHETADTLRAKCPTSAEFLRQLATCTDGFCDLTRARLTEAADELEQIQAILDGRKRQTMERT